MSMIGKTLSHYQITSQLGKGGMGEVYQAKDQKLGRDVAIKVLPEEFAKDADRVARFQREAKLLASLNHPNIAAIYGLEESAGTNFLVMELIEGNTLAGRVKSGPIPVEEALKLALQIAEALEAAHEKSVIHRDLKPANIKVTPDGKVKVLDFGLAKAHAGDSENMNLSNSPTLSDIATQQGVILGTAAYMSPEQARGKPVDKRTDIWAFGVVLFEMLTGKQVFTSDTVSDTLASVLAREPEWQSLPQNLHPRIRLLLERSLKKEPTNRYRDIGDARVDIQEVLADPNSVIVHPLTTVLPYSRLRLIIPWAAATLVIGGIIAGVVAWNLRRPEPSQIIRYNHDLPEGQQYTESPYSPPFALSPDGRQLVYSTYEGLYLRRVDEFNAKPIVGTEKLFPSHPFFSPDGAWVGFYSDGKLKKISINGGTPETLCEISTPMGASWDLDTTIVYFDSLNGLMSIPANGGSAELLVKMEQESPGFIQILPDKESILYTSSPLSDQPKISVLSLKSGKSKELFLGNKARYLPTGHLIYFADNNLYAVRFDLEALEAIGEPVLMVEGVWGSPPTTSSPQYAVSDSGTLVYVPGTLRYREPDRTLVWVDRKGNEEPLAAEPNGYSGLRISPDGTKVALAIGGRYSKNADIYIFDLVLKTMMRLTFHEAWDRYPVWTPDGKRIVFASDRDGSFGIYWKAADNTGKVEMLIAQPDHSLTPMSWSIDENALVMEEHSEESSRDIGMLSMEGERKRTPLLQEEFDESFPQISPDDRWLAYQSMESGFPTRIYMRSFPDVNKGKWEVSTSRGHSPLWSPDSRELFYSAGFMDEMIVSVALETDPTISFGKPKILFSGVQEKYYLNEFTASWDIHPDGKRFLMIKPPKEAEDDLTTRIPRKINIVLNWFEELKEKVPVD